jgi:ABC-type transporter Mla MlaB component
MSARPPGCATPIRQCKVRLGAGGNSTHAHSMSQLGDVATSILEPDDYGGSGGVSVATVELSGQLVGDIGATLKQLDSQLAASSMVSVNCAKLIRVDFVAAGDLLNWVLNKRNENRSITFADAHRLVAMFFAASGPAKPVPRRPPMEFKHPWKPSTAPPS